MSQTIQSSEIVSKILNESQFELVTDKTEEIIEFVHKVSGSEHLLVLWKDQESKDKFVSEFFNKKYSGNSKGYFSVKPFQDESVENTVYEKYYNQHGKEFISKAVDKVVMTMGSNKTGFATRYAFEDDTWLMERGQTEEVIGTEEQLGTKVDENLSLFCFNNVAKLDESKLSRMIPAHGYVILDEPRSLYKFRNL